jgi:hypothetical protein
LDAGRGNEGAGDVERQGLGVRDFGTRDYGEFLADRNLPPLGNIDRMDGAARLAFSSLANFAPGLLTFLFETSEIYDERTAVVPVA